MTAQHTPNTAIAWAQCVEECDRLRAINAELLEALKTVVASFAGVPTGSTPRLYGDYITVSNAAANQARDAIANAEAA